MKRILCIFLSVLILFDSPMIIFAEKPDKFIIVPVEYSDSIGRTEGLELMERNKKIYVNAESLAVRLGYQFKDNNDYITIYNDNKDNNLPIGITQFFFDSTQVKHTLFSQMMDKYEAPFPSIKNDKGSWIPMEYSLLILNSGMLILDNCILIDIPCKSITDYFYEVINNVNTYNFDWNDDFCGSIEMYKKANRNQTLNSFNIFLDSEEIPWKIVFQSLALDSSIHKKNYMERWANFLCFESYDELSILEKKVDAYHNIFWNTGKVKEILDSNLIDSEEKVETIYKNTEKILDDIKNSNSSTINYNKTYQVVKDAFSKEIWFSNVYDNIIERQQIFSDNSSMFDVLLSIAEIERYRKELIQQEEFSISALLDYIDTSISYTSLPKAMKQNIKNDSDDLLNNMEKYSPIKFFDNNINDWIKDSGEKNLIRTYIYDEMFTYVTSSADQFVSGKLSMDDITPFLCLQAFQSDAFLNCQKLYNEIIDNMDDLNFEKLYKLSQYCYIYLKSSYVIRNEALNFWKTECDLSDSQIYQYEWLLDKHTSINHDIVEAISVLKMANESNEQNIYGFLPSSNDDYLKMYDNDNLLNWIKDKENISSIFKLLPKSFSFSSGAGAWATNLDLDIDGSFVAQYHDTNMGEIGDGFPNGTIYVCNFKGKFSNPERINDYTYLMNLESMEIIEEPGGIYYEDGVKYVYSEPYGFDNAEEFLIYIPGIPISELPENFLLNVFMNIKITDTFPYYAIYNVKGEKIFIGYN